ncbi:UNVERIFIED_CONTAM: putative late blight resistance proteinR1B-16 [Sesamum radiatum]|uniref:Late blight resistance proteinR1B-16 n=1 Tax=Sesamum radiatum TaxID=300843 RepID=A0AAW2VKH9_SESRA
MACYADLVSVVQLLEDISRHDQCRGFLVRKKQTIEALHENFCVLKAFLEDYPPRGAYFGEPAADFLERRIRAVVYQVEDIIIQADLKDPSHGKRGSRQLISAFMKLMICSRRQPERCDDDRVQSVGNAYPDLENVKGEVDSIVEDVMRIKNSYTTQIHLRVGPYSPANGGSSKAPGGRSTNMVGFNEYLTTIKDQVCGASSKLQVISIVGMGGIGKTTLASSMFYDALILYYFHIRVWVTVSQDYNVQKVYRSILDSMNITIKGADEEIIKGQIYKNLKGRRYLIIMDDVWDTKVLDDVKRIFPDDDNGSRIVLTTRLTNVATYADPFGFVHQMQFLSEEYSWILLRDKVFGQECCPHKLEGIGRSIAKNCRGLPLALALVGGHLCEVERTPEVWETIVSSVTSVVATNDEHYSNILSLSYNYLPHHLKACFLYMGGFPEDYEISASKLIKLWMAEGFLKSNRSKSLEEVGEEYLEDLVKRNLVLVIEKKSNGKSKVCLLHDLLRDLCIQRARDLNFSHVVDKADYFHVEGVRNQRRLHIYPTDQLGFIKVDDSGSHVRSILCLCFSWELLSFVLDFKHLRVLDMLNIEVSLDEFPASIGELFHLRYLNLDINPVYSHGMSIPISIFRLQNLQTLVIGGSICFISLPSLICKMQQLRHLEIYGINLHPIPYDARIGDKFSVLESLQTFSTVDNFQWTINTIEMIPNLKKLRVMYTDMSTGKWEKYGLNNLINLCQLEKLSIWFITFKVVSDPFPGGFAFPLNLKKLSLVGCRLPWQGLTIVGSLSYLQVLKLKSDSLVGRCWKSKQGEYPQLKYLLMQCLDIEYWQMEDTAFPCLQHLEIVNCDSLNGIPPEVGEIPTLELIEVFASKDAWNSAKQIEEEQRGMGNDVLQVRESAFWNKRQQQHRMKRRAPQPQPLSEFLHPPTLGTWTQAKTPLVPECLPLSPPRRLRSPEIFGL